MPTSADSSHDTAVAVGQEVAQMSRALVDRAEEGWLHAQETLVGVGLPTLPLTPVVRRAARDLPPLTGRLAAATTFLAFAGGRRLFGLVRRLPDDTRQVLESLAQEPRR